MTTRPYELLVRFGNDGNVAGAHVRHLTIVDGRALESDPTPLSSTDDAAFKQFASQFAASAVAERDSLKSQVAELQQQLTAKTTEAATLATEKQSLSEQVDTLNTELAESQANATALQSRVDKLLAEVPFNPRHIRSDAFVDRISSRDMLKLAASTDPVVQQIREKLLQWDENNWRIELDNPETVQPIQYLLAVGVLTEDSAKQLLRDATRAEAYMEAV